MVFWLGLLSVFPSIYVYPLLGILSIFSVNVILLRSRPVNWAVWVYCGSLLLFGVATFIGVFYGADEAHMFFARALLAVLVAVVFSLFDWGNENVLRRYLRGILLGALINSLAVIFFSFYPELYDSYHIGLISGFNKGSRYLRSPGLLTGADNAGFLAVIGMVIFFYLGGRKMRHWSGSRLLLFLLIVTPLFCSRSAMLLSGVMVLLGQWFLPMRLGIVARVITSMLGFMVLGAGMALAILLLSPELLDLETSQPVIFGIPIAEIFMIDRSAGYVAQYDIKDMLTFIPAGNPSDFDNSFARVLASTGIVGFISLIFANIVLFFSFWVSGKGRIHNLAILYFLIFFYINLKNSYFFFTFYVIFNVVLLSHLYSRQKRKQNYGVQIAT